MPGKNCFEIDPQGELHSYSSFFEVMGNGNRRRMSNEEVLNILNRFAEQGEQLDKIIQDEFNQNLIDSLKAKVV